MTKLWARPQGGLFVDPHGRQLILRGVNLGGDSKVPYPDGGTENPSNFDDHRDVSFIGRPFPLVEADDHLGRLRGWGFNCLRLLTTWEAVEHAGPGLYDEDYLDYFAAVCERAAAHGMHVFIDFHQDVWSRLTGGDGAPGWLFEALGMDFRTFHDADVVHLMQRKFDYQSSEDRQAAYPQMSWGTNYRLPVNGIMWSLFWCGRILTPDFLIDGRNVQEFLQGHYLGAMAQVAKRVANMPNVIGFDTLNEPGTGFIGQPMSYRHVGTSDFDTSHPRHGVCLSPADSLAIARGIPIEAPVLVRNETTGEMEVDHHRIINPKGVSIWTGECPFELAGAYRPAGDHVEVINETFFSMSNGTRLDMSEDGYKPFFFDVASRVREHNPDWVVFGEMDPFGVSGGRQFPSKLPDNMVNATHWYDRAILFRKAFDPTDHLDMVTGKRESEPSQIRERFVRELQKRDSRSMGFAQDAPTLIGEFGIPYDLHDGEAYRAWTDGRRDAGIWAPHIEALSLMYDALDELQFHSTQWNYSASNRNDLRIGDRWNQEDLSIFSVDQQTNPANLGSGGRAIEGFCRPYVQATQGRLLLIHFDRHTGNFACEIEMDPTVDAPTVLFVPADRYHSGYELLLSDSSDIQVERQAEEQLLTLKTSRAGRLSVDLRVAEMEEIQ